MDIGLKQILEAEKLIINFVKNKQKEKTIPHGRIKVMELESSTEHYTIIGVSVKPLFRNKRHYVFKYDLKSNRIKEIFDEDRVDLAKSLI